MGATTSPRSARFTFAIEPRSVLSVGVLLAVVLAGVSWLIQTPQADVPDLDVNWNRLNVDSEYSIATWASSSALLVAAAMMYSFSRSDARWRLHWVLLSGIFVLLSIDEAIAIHEESIDPLRSQFDTGGVLFFAWVIPAAVAVVVLAVVLRRFLRDIPSPARGILLLAAGLYVGGALGMEMVGGAIADSRGQRNIMYITGVTIEELLEMLGITVLLYGLARLRAESPRSHP